VPAGDGCFRLVGAAPAEPLQFKRGEIVECTIRTLPNGKKGLVATNSISADPEFRKRRNVFATLGALVGAVIGLAVALWFFRTTLSNAAIGAGIGAVTFGFCSVRWGDAAWEILGNILRWF
jgi:hypothetical protein